MQCPLFTAVRCGGGVVVVG
jgi:hypothetical protein